MGFNSKRILNNLLQFVISSVINRPAMLAVTKVTKHAEIKARTASFVTSGLRSGARAEIPPIMIPTEAGLAKLQMAKVAIAEDLD